MKRRYDGMRYERRNTKTVTISLLAVSLFLVRLRSEKSECGRIHTKRSFSWCALFRRPIPVSESRTDNIYMNGMFTDTHVCMSATQSNDGFG